MWKKTKVTDQTATEQGGIKRRSKVPGVMITQYVEELPEGKSTPDFKRKPIALTIQEGKLAIFKAIVIGEPKPTVSWQRAKGVMNDPEKFQNKFDPITNEHTLEIPKVSGEEADTYKCFAANEYGKAVCTAVLNVIEVGFKKNKAMKKEEDLEDLAEFRNKLRRSAGKKVEKKDGEIDEAVWDLLLSADKKDYERICIEYGITDYRGMLKKLTELKKQREQEQALFIKHISNLKHIEVKSEGSATFELELELNDPNSRIFLYKNGIMVPYSKDNDSEMKHYLKQVGKKYVFTVRNLSPEDAGIYQVDVEGINVFSTDFKISPVDFLVKIQEVKAEEREDAMFECVTSLPMNQITWTLKNNPLSKSNKYEITVSEDKLIHRLKIIDCMPVDAGIYTAIAGINSCSAWLLVEADKDPAMKGKKAARKTTQAGGSEADLAKIAAAQLEKNKKEMEDALEAAKRARFDQDTAAGKAKAEAEAALAASRAAAAAKAAAAAQAAEAALAAGKVKGMSEKDAKAQAEAAAAAAASRALAEAEANARKMAEAKAKEAGLSAEDIAKAGAVAAAMLSENLAAIDELGLGGACMGRTMGEAESTYLRGVAGLAGSAGVTGDSGATGGSVLAGRSGADEGSWSAGGSGAAGGSGLAEGFGAAGGSGAVGGSGIARASGAAGGTGIAGGVGLAGISGAAKGSGFAGGSGAAGGSGLAEGFGAAGGSGAAGGTGLAGGFCAAGSSGAAGGSDIARGSSAAGGSGFTGGFGLAGDSGAAGGSGLAGGVGLTGTSGPAQSSGLAGCIGGADGAGDVGQAGFDALSKNGADYESVSGGKSWKHAGAEAVVADTVKEEQVSPDVAPVGQTGKPEHSKELPEPAEKETERTEEQSKQAMKQTRVRQGPLLPDTVIVGGNPHGNPSSNPGHNPGGNPGHNPTGNPGHKQGSNPGHNPGGNPGHNPTGNPGHKQGSNPGHNPGGNPGHNPTGNPGHKQGSNPGHNPGLNPGHNPSGNPGHKQGSNPGHNPGGNPDPNPSGNPGHNPGSNPGHKQGSNPGHNPSRNPDDKSSDNPADNPGGNGVKLKGSEGAPPGGEATEVTKDESAEAGKRSGQTRQGPLLPEAPTDAGVHFSAGLEDCRAIVGESAELVCKLSSAISKGLWYKDGKEISGTTEGMTISKDGDTHKLKIHKVSEEFSGKYKFEAEGRKTEAMIIVEDPPRFATKDLEEFVKPKVVKINQKAEFKIPYIGHEANKIQWYKEGEELTRDANCRIVTTEGHCRLSLNKVQRKDKGEIKIKIKNDYGTVEATTNLVVLDKPTPPLGPLEIIEASPKCIEFKWRPPKDDGSCPITHYFLERNQIGRNTWKKIGQIPGEAHYKDTDVEHGKRYCYRITAENSEGVSELMETEDVQAGTKSYSGPPSAPKVVSAFKDCITLSWIPPTSTGGTDILGYNLEKRKKGSNVWNLVHPPEEPIRTKKYACEDVIEGNEYEFRVSAVNISGPGEPSAPSEIVAARDPKTPPGKVIDLKLTGSTYNTLTLSWTKPKAEGNNEAKGYFVEIRPAESTEWNRCNTSAIIMNTYTVKGLKALAMYWVRVIAVNEGGAGEPTQMNKYILAMPPPVRPKFKDSKIKSSMIVKAGNSGRFNINFVASPYPEVIWLKDGIPVSKRVTVSHTEGGSQILIPSAERADSGIYSIVIKNVVGQETFSVDIRVTDEPKPPGPVELEMNVPGTVTISWAASPDEKRDDRLHYMVTKKDSVKQTWHTVADRIFNNKFTACNILPGREYLFRVYAKNDMGESVPSESPKWLITEKKEKYILTLHETKPCNLEGPPKFLVSLKQHAAPEGYECYLNCAVRGNPSPRVTWYHNNVNIHTDSNYYITNTCGVCSMLILRVATKDTGEYKVIAENPLGRAECSTRLIVRE